MDAGGTLARFTNIDDWGKIDACGTLARFTGTGKRGKMVDCRTLACLARTCLGEKLDF
jgi:hypothetical protein